MNVVQKAADRFVRWAFDADPATWPHTWLVHAGFLVLTAVAVLTFVAVFAGPLSWIERRVAGRIQSRVGPNRVGPQGSLQWLADGIKCFLKEDLIPAEADGILFRLAPYLVFTGMFGAFVVLPFGAHMIAADLNVGVLYILAITSLVVVGLLMAGWGSHSKWALFGGVRSAAQLVSYEVPAAFSLLAVIVQAGTMSTQGIVAAQGGWPWDWFFFKNPFLFVAFFI
jgi:NADH-quinone oxidoreductase subunit H